METKTMIWIGILVGSTVGGAIGALFDGGLGIWTVLLSTIGGIVGIWAVHKLS